jgi:hypothetical protein
MVAPSKVDKPRTGPVLAGYALLALFFAFFDLRLIVLLLPKPFIQSALVGEGVYHGEPPWRVYQSRVLGPYLVHGLSEFFHVPIPTAYVGLAIFVLFVAGFATLVLTDRLRDPARPPLATFLLGQLLFVMFCPCLWIYAWDLLSLPLFVFFNYLVLRGSGRLAFAAVYAVAVFNHEIAFFIAGWLVLDPLFRWWAGGRAGAARIGFDWRTSALGAVLLGGGVTLVAWLRKTLLVRESLHPGDLSSFSTYGQNFHYSLRQNWNSIGSSLSPWTR